MSLIAEGILAFKHRVAAFPKFIFLYTTYEEMPDITSLLEHFLIKFVKMYLVTRKNQLYASINQLRQTIDYCLPGVCINTNDGFILTSSKGAT